MIEGWDEKLMNLYPDLDRAEAKRSAEKLEDYLRLLLRIHERLSLENHEAVRVVRRDGPLTDNSNRLDLHIEPGNAPSQSADVVQQ